MADTADNGYCRDVLPSAIVERLEAGAFRQLCRHLQERCDEVQNMDLMTLSGFCRNCLAKWMMLEARTLVDSKNKTSDGSDDHAINLDQVTINALNAMGYEEAAQHVYGMTYGEWKKRHQKKATDEQLERFKASAPLHAKHDKALLATRAAAETPTTTPGGSGTAATTESSTKSSPPPLASNVCCQEVEQVAVVQRKPTETEAVSPSAATKPSRTLPPYSPAPLPNVSLSLRVAVLTVSDRAFKGEYEQGDLSGPAVEEAIRTVLETSARETLKMDVVQRSIVPDEIDAIRNQLVAWCDESSSVDLILTTGGTGMSPRDVTPEATQQVLTTECAGLMPFVLSECSRLYQPLATLSRGTAGICKRTLVANLPGNPKAVGEIMPLLLPLLLHAKKHMG